MKKATRFLMAAFMLTAFVGFVACDPDENKPDPGPGSGETYEASASYAIYVDGVEIPAGNTYAYQATETDLNDDIVVIRFIVENKTTSRLTASHKLELLEGPSAFNGYEVCAGVSCPWDGNPYPLDPGMNTAYPIKYDIAPSQCPAGSSALYKLTVGTGNGLSDPQVIFFRISL